MSLGASLLENLERLRAHVEAVRGGSPTARDDLATVLHILVGGTGGDDGYGLLTRTFEERGVEIPLVPGWGTGLADTIDGEVVAMSLRGTPPSDGAPMPLADRLAEPCLRWAVDGFPPAANWSYLDLIKKTRNKFGSHVDGKPPRWLEELRFYPAGDADAVTFLLWRAGEEVLTAATTALASSGGEIDAYDPVDRYLNGIDLIEAHVLGTSTTTIDMRANLACAEWSSGVRRAVIGASLGATAFLFGIEADGRLSLSVEKQGDVANLHRRWVAGGLRRVGRNDPCPCENGRKYKYCHGR